MTARRIRLVLIALCGLLILAWAVLTVVTRDPWPTNDGLTVLVTGLIAAVGLVIVDKQPRNAVGWLLVATAVVGLVDSVDRLYLVLDYRRHDGSLPLGKAAVAWRGGVALLPFLIAFPAVLLFPDGRIPSRRWKQALGVYVVLGIIFSLLQFSGEAVNVPDRASIDIRGNVPDTNPGTVAGAAWFAVPFFLAFWLASVGHQVRSFRRAEGERRAQLKWLAAGSALAIAGAVGIVTLGDGHSTAARLTADLSMLAIAAFPLAIGIGILRYRLYEIDRLISRTITYALVTGTLIGLFAALVVLLTDVLPFSSPVGVAASTLAAAALFNPLRRRVQKAIDRRFNRARYDAVATVEAFAQQLRNAVDLDTVEAGLRDAVGRAVEPAHLTVWLRAAP